jgi:preprotein translocase subunit SecG
MVYAHMLQFFGNGGAYPAIPRIIDVINVLVFPTFVFCFGRSAAIAYLQKPFKAAAPRLARMTLSLYAVFVLSGLGFRILVDHAPFNTITVEKVLLLSDIPGWSEFLAAFAAYALVTLILLKPMKMLSNRFVPTLIASAVCLGLCFLPYDLVKAPQIGLFIGTRGFACFPVVQYAPYLLAGIYWQTSKKHGVILSLIGLAATVAGVIFTVINGLPERFPPSLPWVLLTGFFPAAMSFLTARIETVPRLIVPADGWLRNIGRKSLFYLLASNLTIFTLSGMNAAPMVTKRNIWFWKQSIGSPLGSLLWTAMLFIAIGLIASLAGRSSEKQQKKQETAVPAP